MGSGCFSLGGPDIRSNTGRAMSLRCITNVTSRPSKHAADKLEMLSRRYHSMGERICRITQPVPRAMAERYAVTGQFGSSGVLRLNAANTPNITADVHHK